MFLPAVLLHLPVLVENLAQGLGRDSKTCGRAAAQKFSDFAQNLEIRMHKLNFFILTSFLLFFLHFSHILSDF